MSNNNTIVQFIAGSGSTPVQNTLGSLSNIGTTETAFTVNPNPLISSLGGGPAIVRLEPGIWDGGRPFVVRAYGKVTTANSTNLTLKLYQVPSAIITAGTAGTLGNDNALKASTARAVNSSSSNFLVEAKLQWDSVSQQVNGTAKFLINDLLDSEAAVTQLTGITADTELNFLLSGAFSSGNAANVVSLSEFSAEQV